MHAKTDVIALTASSLGLSELDHQEIVFIQGMINGFPARVAAKNAGVPQSEAIEFASRPHVAMTIAYLREQEIGESVHVTRDMVNLMFFDAYNSAATATEMVNAAREIGKLNGLYAPTRIEQEVSHNTKTESQLKQLSSEELAKMAGDDIIDADFVEIEDNSEGQGE